MPHNVELVISVQARFVAHTHLRKECLLSLKSLSRHSFRRLGGGWGTTCEAGQYRKTLERRKKRAQSATNLRFAEGVHQHSSFLPHSLKNGTNY